ncbi:MAG TPA: mannitol dehydrogenase family protein [Nocardioidaceae bacterium]|nr:mannitol dehydrogenase family protein [Nocardioidaceae bacterium]
MTSPALAPPALALDDSTVARLPEAVRTPTYDRRSLAPAVVHFGVGGFHRAHQAVYLDDLAELGDTGWGLTGVGLRSPQMGEVLAAQDGLFVVVERTVEEDLARVIGVMGRYLFGPEDPEAVLATLADERTRLVTLTITGTSYLIDPSTGEFEADEEITSDLEGTGQPSTTFGYLVEALDRRRAAGLPPFTVLSCDNMPNNGAAARTAVVSFARLRDQQLGDWIDEHVSFPSSMVDRITPNTSPEERDAIVADIGVADRWPVVTEPFRQWIVEDAFCNGRPPLEQVGAQLVADVAPYEQMKTRLLNGGHTALGFLGYLAGFRTTDEVIADPVYRDYLATMMAEEIVPGLADVPGIDLAAYQQTLIDRLANPRMGDQLARLCRRGSTKIPNYVLPSVRAAMEDHRSYTLLALAVAGWVRFLRGYDYAGDELPVVGPRMHLMEVARDAGTDPGPLLSEREVFGELGEHADFLAAVRTHLEALERQGPREVIAECLADLRSDRR